MARSKSGSRDIQQVLRRAMIKPLKVTANLGEMLVKGSMREYISTNMPSLYGIFEENADIGGEVVSFIKDPKDSISRAIDSINSTETVQAARKIANAAIDDLKTGKFYSAYRDREGGNDGLLDDFGGFDFGGFDDEGNWDESFEDTSKSDDIAVKIAEKQEDNADKRTEAMISAIGTSAEATNRTQLAIHKEDVKSALKRHAQTMSSLANITTMQAATYETMNNHLTAMTEMSREMHKNMMGELTQIRTLLTEIRDHQIPKKESSPYREDRNPINPSTGSLNIKNYVKHALKNIGEQTGLDMVTSILDPQTIGDIGSQNPLQFVTDALLAAVIPRSTKKAMTRFDNTLRGFFPSLLNRIYNYGENTYDEGPLPFLARIFGLQSRKEGFIDPSRYNKDKVDFTGKVAKAITEVMPSQLSKIISLLSGEPMKLYDYDSGKFVRADRAFAETSRRQNDLVGDMYETRNAFLTRINASNFRVSDDERRGLRDAAYRFMSGAANDQAFITNNMTEDKFNQLSFSPYDVDQRRILYSIIRSMSHEELNTFNREIMNARVNNKGRIDNIQRNLESSGLLALYNGMAMSPEQQRRIADRVLESDTNVASMDRKDYNAFMGRTLSDYKNTGVSGLLTNIQSILNRGIIVYANSVSGGVSGYQAALDAQKEALRSLGRNPSTGGFDSDESISDAEKKREESRGKFKTDIRSSGKFTVDSDSPVEDLIKSFSGIEGEEYRIYENEEDQKHYEKVKAQQDKWKKKATSPLEKLQNAFRKPFDLIERGLSVMDRAMYRLVYGDDAAKLFKDGQDEDHSIMAGVTTMMQANLNKFTTWFKDSVVDKFFTDEDAPFKRAKDFGKRWTIDKAKSGWDRLRNYAAGEKDEEGNYSGGRFSGAVNAVRSFGRDSKNKVKTQMDGFLDSFKNSLNTVLYGDEWHQKVIINEDGSTTYSEPYKVKGKGGIVGMFKDAGQRLKDFLFGTDENSDSKKLWNKVTEETKKALPGAGAGAVIGGVGTIGTGLLTGLWLPGGPIFGAMLGSAAGFIGASDTLKNYLFGPAIDPEDPSKGRKGGIIEKNVQDAVKQYAPKALAGAGIGALAGNFGLLPLGIGPVAGTAIGSFGGMISANKELRELIFGKEDDDDSGYISKNTRRKMARALPGFITGGLGINAIVGGMSGMGLLPSLLTMPGGPIVTALGGLAGMFAGPKIEKFFFGEKDEKGKWIPGKEGVFGTIFNFGKNKLFDPFFSRVNEMAKGIGGWFEKKIMDPLRESLDPIKKEMKEGGGFVRKAFRGFANILKGAVDKVFEKAFGKPLSTIAESIADKSGKAVNAIVTGIGKSIGKVIATPFALLRMYGNHLRKKQDKRRNKRFKQWLKDNPGGTEEEFDEFDQANQGFSVTKLFEEGFNKADKKAKEKGSSADNPIQDIEDRRNAKTSSANEAFGISDKVRQANDKANPPNSAETRSATSLEKIEDKVVKIADFILGRRDMKAPGPTGWDRAHAGDNLGSALRGGNKVESTAGDIVEQMVDDTGERTYTNKAGRKFTRSRKKRVDKVDVMNWTWTGQVDYNDDEGNAQSINRQSRTYRSLYQRFNTRVKNSKDPQKAMDEIILSAPANQQGMYRTVLKDIATLNDPNGGTGGMAGKPTEQDEKGGGLLDLLGSNAGLLGGIAGLLLTLMGGDGSMIGNILKGVIMAKVGSKIFKIGKGIWDFGKKTVSAVKKGWKALTSPLGQTAAGAGVGAFQLMDETSTNDSFGWHNLYNAGKSFTKTAAGKFIGNSFAESMAKYAGGFAEDAGEQLLMDGFETAAKEGTEQAAKSGVSGLVQRITKAVTDKLASVLNSKTVKWIAGNKLSTKLSSAVNTVASFLGKHLPSTLTNAAKGAGKSSVRQASAIPVAGLIITGAFGVYDFFSGMGDSYKYFGIKPSDATLGMKISSGICKLVVGLLTAVPAVGMLLSLIPVSPLATSLYKLFANSEQEAELAEKQESMTAQVEQYNAANGTDYSVSEYLEKIDPETGEEKEDGLLTKAWNWITGKKQYEFTKRSDGRYETYKIPKGVKYATRYDKEQKKTVYIVTSDVYNQMVAEGQVKNAGNGRGRGYGRGNTIYDQTDPRWNAQDPSMKDSGCGPTVAAMMVDRLGRGPDPVEASQMAYNNGYRDADGGTDPNFFSAYGAAHGVNMHRGATDAQSIGSSLASGNPVALMGQGGAFGSGSHYMLADGINGGNVSLVDPIGGRRTSSSLNALASKSTAAIYGSGRQVLMARRRSFGRGTLASLASGIKDIITPKNKEEGKTLSGNKLSADEITKKTKYVGEVLPDDFGRGRGLWGRGTAKEQAAKVLQIAEGEVGYQEKASNSNLDDPTANAGYNNYTKYGAWYGLNGPGAPWCAMFVSWCCNQAGVSTDIVPKTASVADFTSFAKNHNQFHAKSGYTPQPGDIIIYGSAGNEHTGLVYGTDGDNVITIEGNTSSGNNADGGSCKKKTVSMSNSWIYGYFTPAYDGKMVSVGDGSDSGDSEESSTPTGLSILTSKMNEKLKPITDAITKAGEPLTKMLNSILGTSTSSSSSDSESSSGSSGSLPSGDMLIGDYVKQFESGDAGPRSISSGSGDYGGVSFGTYQFPSYNKTPSGGLLQKFWETYYAKDYPNVTPGNNQAFKDAWLDAVNKDEKTFHKREWMISKDGDYMTAKNLLKQQFNYDPDKDSRAAQEAIWSTALQGPGIVPGNYKRAFGSVDSTSMDDAEWVKKFYQAKRDMIPQNFRSSSASVQSGVRNRYINEEPIVAKLAGQKPLDYGQGRGRFGRGRNLNSDLSNRVSSLNATLGRGRKQAESEARVDSMVESMEATAKAYGKGPGNGDNEVLNKMLDLFQQIVPILKNIETNTGKSQESVPTGQGGKGRNNVKHANAGRGTQYTVDAGSNRDRIGSVVNVGTTSVDRITRR